MITIPAIDILDGSCVRLSQGDYARCKVYSNDPVEVARRFEAAGFRRLHVVDLDGARSAGVVNLRVLEKICTRTSLSVDFGGGIKSDNDIRRVFAAGADFTCIGSVAATDPELTTRWLSDFGRDRLIISADIYGGMVRTHGWKHDSGMSINDLISFYGMHIRWLMCTDIERDGMLCGAAAGLYRRLSLEFPFLDIIASGGIGSVEDIAALAGSGVSGVVVGKALYEGRITVEELMEING